MYQLMYGKFIAEEIFKNIKIPMDIKMAIILVGDDPASHIYVRNKIKKDEQLGIKCDLYELEKNVSEGELLSLIDKLNNDDTTGIVVQLPLPKHLNSEKIIRHINPLKDIDGLHPLNYGKLILKNDLENMLIPATPLGVYSILDYYDIDTCGKNCVIVGRGLTVGTPLSILLSKNIKRGNCTVTLCNSKTMNLSRYTSNADILISAVGKPNFIKENMVKEGAVVIDVGISRVEDKSKKNGERIVGDVDFEKVKDKCSFITPVPGGVGPMTIAGLILNLLKAYKMQKSLII